MSTDSTNPIQGIHISPILVENAESDVGGKKRVNLFQERCNIVMKLKKKIKKKFELWLGGKASLRCYMYSC